MAQLKFSVAERGGNFLSFLRESLAAHAQVESIGWGELWAALRKTALAKSGFDLSEIGSTWLGSCLGMSALRPFSARDMAQFGGVEGFLPVVWPSSGVSGHQGVWSIPWLADARVIYYWRDALETAGVDEISAFSTP